MYRFLDKIDSPADLRKIDRNNLSQVCEEIRDYMVRCCSRNPGHLASSLGAVELIVGMHYVYDTPEDKIVFDVGHQAYAHKILTGRREAFMRNRQADGLSGFPCRDESPFDAFGGGHSSVSISAALGLAQAASLGGDKGKVVALLGDGALTGGLAYEALNNVSGADLLVILNDNNQSIDRNLGAMHDYLLRLTTDATYNRIKNRIWNHLGESKVRSWLQKITRDTKSNLVRESGGALFEALGFRYFGPIDGNDIDQVVTTLHRLRGIKGPRILHVHTVKGKGYAPAEADPTVWHAPGKFNPETGERLPAPRKADRYQDVFGAVLTDLAGMDSRVVGITPAMATGCGMNIFEEKYPGRFFDVGIEEEHAVTFSAGLAAGGMRPYCNIYSSFSQRAYDQIIHDVALQHLPVVLCFDRAGLVGEDGATHHGCFDLAAYRSIPGATICAPRDEMELKNLMYSALQSESGPYIIRYPRGCGEGVEWRETGYSLLHAGSSQKLREGRGIAILALGPSANRAAEAADRYKAEKGKEVAVYDVRFLKPFDQGIIDEILDGGFSTVLTLEDGTLKGGLYSEVCERLSGTGVKVFGHGIPDKFIAQDRQDSQRAACGLDTDSIYEFILQKLVS